MANIKQQKKRVGIAARQRLENLRYKSTIRTLFTKLQLHVDLGDKENAEATHKELVRLLDRAASRKSLHRNTVARKKARASRMLLQEAKTETTTVRRAKKKTSARKPKADGPAKKEAAEKPAAKKAPAKKAAPKAKAADAKAKDADAAADEAAADATEAPAEEAAAPEAEAETAEA
jgi:ribosomal protein S20